MAMASGLWRPPLLQACFDSRVRQFERGGLIPTFKHAGKPALLVPLCRASIEDNEADPNERKKNDQASSLGEKTKEGESSDSIANQDVSQEKIISGSPLPGVKAPFESVKIPRTELEMIRNQVFSFDTFFPTDQEYYEAGVIFKGNLRGQPRKSYEKISTRLQDKFGDEYKLFLLSDPKEDKPLAAVVRNLSLQPEAGAVPEWLAVAIFGLVTVATILLRNSSALQMNFLRTNITPALVLDALPGALVTISVLLVHEIGHVLAAKKVGAKLRLPYYIPSWQLGSFGGITKVSSVLGSRDELIEMAASGPLAGAAFALSIIFVGLAFPPEEGKGLLISAAAFHDSFLVGGIAKFLLGESLKEGRAVTINPIVVSAWSGLLINAINCIPIGELDGGLVAQGLWGRKAWSRFTGVSLALLGLTGLFSDIALYWVVLVVFLQRGPIPPQADELTLPSTRHVVSGVLVLLLSLLVCFPFPFSFS